MPRLFALAAATATSVALLVVTLVFALGGSHEGESPVGGSADNHAAAPANSPASPAKPGLHQVSVYTLPWQSLIRHSDIVVVGIVSEKGDLQRSPGSEGLSFVRATYIIDVEDYLKGEGDDTLRFAKTIAHEYSAGDDPYSVRDRFPELEHDYTLEIDDPEPLTVGERYIFALRRTSQGWVSGTAEPFRFVLRDGVAVAESGMIPDWDLERRFPPRPENEAVAEVEAVVDRAAGSAR